MTTSPEIESNPFVGPNPLDRTDGIFGRDEEIRELKWLFTAERVVWLHSPSGAGKTSLVQAGLIPRLEKDDFEVLPLIRVGLGLAGKGAGRYAASVRASLNEGQSDLSLSELMEQRRRGKSLVLVFDQFEEVIALDPTDIEEKNAFFKELGQVLQLSDVWALFVIREDFLAAIDPYAHYIPTLLNHRFRLEVLTIAQARQAMQKIAMRGLRTIDPKASEMLTAELAKTQVRTTSGEDWKPGRFIEPVMLQVVCRSVWAKMAVDERIIEKRHIPTGEKITEALANYYADSVKSVSETQEVERNVRNWFGENLITGGIRSQVLDAKGDGGGIGLDVATRLVETHLIRRDDRSGRTWYELAHDRLIGAVQQDNQQWFEASLHWVQKRADLWHRQSSPTALLLADDDLQKAEQWLNESHSKLTGHEQRFMDQSRAQQKVRDRMRLWSRVVRILAVVLGILLVVSVVLYFHARREERLARSRELRAVAQKELREGNLACAVQDAREGLKIAETVGPAETTGAMELLSEVLQGDKPAYQQDRGRLSLAFVERARVLALANERQITLYPVPAASDGSYLRRFEAQGDCKITAIAPNPAAQTVAVGFQNGAIRFATGQMFDCGKDSGVAIQALSISRNGVIAAATSNGIMAGDKRIIPNAVWSLVWGSNGDRLAAGFRDGTIRIQGLDSNVIGLPLVQGKKSDRVNVVWRGRVIAAASPDNNMLWIWDSDGDVRREEPSAHINGIVAIALIQDESLVATAGLDNQTKVWSTRSKSPPLVLRAPQQNEAPVLTDLVFLNNAHLAVADSNGDVRVYPLDLAGIKVQAQKYLADKSCNRGASR